MALRKSTRSAIAVGLAVLVGIGCGSFGGSDGTPTPTASSDAGVVTDAAGGTDGSIPTPNLDGGGSSCTKTEEFVAEADSLIASSDTKFGGTASCNVGIGACVVRFKLSAHAAAAVQTRAAAEMSLTLTRAVTSNDCNKGVDGGCLMSPFTAAAGAISTSPMRSDWAEATVTWDWPVQSGTGWGAPGASQPGVDRDAVIGSMPLDAVSPSFTIPMFAKDLDPKWLTMQPDGQKLSFVIALNGGALLFITKEASVATNQAPTTPPATLSITYPCP